MSDALNLALTITAVDLAGGVLRRLRERVIGTGAAADQVRKHFDEMEKSIRQGTKAIAVAGYMAKKLQPGVRAASDLQESMLDVKALLWDSSEGATRLAQKLAMVRSTATQVSANLPYSAKDLATIEANLLQGGVALDAIIGKRGAAFATAALAATGHMDPGAVSESMAKIGHAFQLQGKQYGGAADYISKLSSSSPAKLGELLYGLRQAGPAAHALNIPLNKTAAALAAVSSIGLEAGSNLKQFFVGLTAGTPDAQKALKYINVSFFDKKGQFVGIDESIKRLRAGLSKVHSQQKRMIILQKVFQTEGAQAAKLLLQEGNKSYDDIKRKADAAAGLMRREKIWAEGLNASVSKLGGSTQSTLANLFNPMLGPLTEVVNKSNELVSNLGDLAQKHRGLAETVSGVGAAAVIGTGVYGIGKLLKGGVSGARLMRTLRGTATGVAAGKALQAAAGVTPVYVVNMPSGGFGGSLPESFGGKKLPGGIAQKVRKLSSWDVLKKANMGEIKALGPGAMLRSAGYVGMAGAAGYAAGTEIYDHAIAGTTVGDKIGSGIAHVLALFGDKTAKDAIAATERAQQLNGTIKIEVDNKTGQARVTQMNMDHSGVEITADHGLAAGGW